MKHNDGSWVVYDDNKLVIRWRKRDDRKVTRFQGKRVAKDCPLARKYRRVYVKQGIVACVKALKQEQGMSISDAVQLIRQARGEW